ncbi:PDDEXK nuclease domain-containing protein [Leucothrix mucor]|uniref:PDDEXK nuclease domain-containing protein n=1 Tax=Leucothrix mucor TaxID=45248 RepID=UPI0003B5C980|nr:PDDEXK nuclease domain-containing protein [Leucothrix mucor]
MSDLQSGDYQHFLTALKTQIQHAQQRAALAVNQELLKLYWQVGHDILKRQQQLGWGSKVIEQLAADLRKAFPELKGFSRSNLLYMRSFAENWPNFESDAIVQQAVGQIPWGHNIVLLGKLKDKEKRLSYALLCQQNGWSRNVLIHQIESQLLERKGNAITNFENTLATPQSELAQEALKDPYIFDFLSIGEKAKERDIEQALTQHISQFLLELGAGFAFVGRQVHLEVGEQDFYLDLLFYHLKLRCYLVVELKAGDFKPEHTGQLSFYLSAVDSQIKTDEDGPTIGLLLCKSRNKVIAEYALRDNSKPIGVAEYQLAQALPVDFESKLPSIERIEAELARDLDDE